MKRIFTLSISFLLLLFFVPALYGQSVPQAFTYQAIARNNAGQPLINQNVGLKLSILENSPNGQAIYTEDHNGIQTNKFGLFTLEIGKGASGDDFQEIDWRQGTFYVQTEVDSGNGPVLEGTFPILSVPYAIIAQRAIEDAVEDADANPQNEIQELALTGTTITLSNGGGSINLPTGTTDTDNQELQLNGTILSIDDGNQVDLSSLQSGGTDADADPQNEIQELTLDGSTIILSNGGGSINLPTGTTDTDNQELQLNGTILSIDDGNQVDLSSLQSGAADADADPQNEIQELTLDGTTITLSNGGGSINLPAGTTDTDDQELTLTGTTLSIDDGNQVDLSSLQDGTEDADADPQNEIQELELNGSTLTLSNGGGSVNLPAGGSSLWKEGNGYIFYEDTNNEEIVKISDVSSQFVSAGQNGDGMEIDAVTSAGNGIIIDAIDDYLSNGTNSPDNFSSIDLLADNKELISIAASSRGIINLPDNKVLIAAEENSGGRMELFNEAKEAIVYLGNNSAENDGALALRNGNGTLNAQITSGTAGAIVLFGENGEINAGNLITTSSPNHGSFGVFNATPTINNGAYIPDAQLYVDREGNGAIQVRGSAQGFQVEANIRVDPAMGAVVEANVKNFVMDHPTKKNKEIVYACIEGPEAAAYERGTGTLKNGKGFIPFSEHFQLVINSETMTVNLTPLSANTMGLAVIKKTNEGVYVQELMNGQGDFDFDWEVKAVRKGYENYTVIRDKLAVPEVVLPTKINQQSNITKDEQ